MNKTELIQKLRAIDGLTADEKAALIKLVNTNKKYGLVWEDKAEDVEEELRQKLPVLTEVTDRRILAAPTIADQQGTGTQLAIEVQMSVTTGDTPAVSPNHILIEGDNLHALTALSFTHEGRVDVIYIDPPYNTGNKDFKYNDRFVDKEDNYRHSMWLSFMQKRLILAKRMLKESGVIFISIDDNEQAQLKLLCNEVFGERNFLAEVIIETATDNNPRQIAIEHEYLVAYANKIETQKKWGIINEGANKIQAVYEHLKSTFHDNYSEINKGLKSFIKENIEEMDKFKVGHYQFADSKGVYFKGDISNTKPGGYDIELIHPTTKKSCRKPPNGYRFKPDTLFKMAEDDDIEFGADEKTIATVKRRMNDLQEKFRSIYYEDGRAATGVLKNILGKKAFNNPKSILLLSRLIRFSSTDSSLILDFFAGSGTTLHATMQLNDEDGGNRQCILVTNNENNICEEVTYERNKRIIQGYTNSKGAKVCGLTANNLRYYKTAFVPSSRSEQNKRLLTAASTELLSIKEDCYIDITAAEGFASIACRIFTNNVGKYLVVVYHSRVLAATCEQLVDWIKQVPASDQKIALYVFSPERETLAEDFYEVADRIVATPLPEAIYNAYRATFRSLKLDKKPPASAITEESFVEADTEIA